MFGDKLLTLALSRATFTGSTDALENATELSTLLLSTNRWVCDVHPQNARHLGEGLFISPEDLVKKTVGYKLQSVDRVFASNPWDKPEETPNRIAAFSGNLGLTGNIAWCLIWCELGLGQIVDACCLEWMRHLCWYMTQLKKEKGALIHTHSITHPHSLTHSVPCFMLQGPSSRSWKWASQCLLSI